MIPPVVLASNGRSKRTSGTSDLQTHRQLTEYFAPLPRAGFARNNAIAVFLMGALPAVGGSVISVMMHTFIVWAVISLALGRFQFRMTRDDRMLAWTLTAFAVVIVITALTGNNPEQAPRSTLWLITFLAPWVMIPRLRASPDVDYLLFYLIGAAVGALGACVLAVIQLTALGIRVEGGAGNADVFAIITLCLMGLGGLNMSSSSNRRTLLGVAAVVAGGLAIVLSLTRGVAIAALPMIAFLVAFAPAVWRSVLSRPAILLVLIAAGLVILGGYHALDQRWQQTSQELQLVLNDQHSGSIGERLRLWTAAAEAISQSPAWGYGIQNRMAALLPTLKLDNIYINNFTHAHNGFLSFALDGGILVLAALIAVLYAPVALAWRAPRDTNYRRRLFAAIAVSGTYVLCGMTQIMFKHDIMDSFFVFFAILIAASIPENNTKQR